jgi:hypothetical protein
MNPEQEELERLKRLKDLLLEDLAIEAEIEKQKLAFSRYRTSARPHQLPPDGDWRIWLVISGRGWGKTFTGAGWLCEKALMNPGTEWAVVAPTFTDVRRTCVEGPSGIIKSLTPEQLKFYNRSNGQITLVNGSKIHMISADEPDRARGLNLSGAWLDEFAAWRYEETWTAGLAPALRIGNPQVVITTTPRPTKLIKEFANRTDGSVVVTRGSTFDNAANLSEAALAELRTRYEGTRIGRQELYGELLSDNPDALWNLEMIDSARIWKAPQMVRVVVAIDPAVTSGEDADETGIVVVGKGEDGRAYVLADRSCRDTPSGWAHRAVAAYHEFSADRVVAEKNQGGDMVELTIRSVEPTIPYKGITAKVGKRLRGEPIAALYEQGRVSHVGTFDTLEDQMTGWIPDSGFSPDRLDALVHGITELGLATGASADRFFAQLAPACTACGFPNDSEAFNCKGCGVLLREPQAQLITSGINPSHRGQ